jgi:hypothetical protein
MPAFLSRDRLAMLAALGAALATSRRVEQS